MGMAAVFGRVRHCTRDLATRCIGLCALLFVLAILLASAAIAVQPDEILDDPALETRAREISQELRCLICRNESIDDSNADLARDLRLLVRERLVAGDTDAEVKQFLVDRYGEFVLLRPRWWVLWALPGVVFLVGFVVAILYMRQRRPPAPGRLTAEEEAALARVLEDR